MPRVAVSGYITGVRQKENKEGKPYGIVDLLQFGDSQSDSELIHLIVYEPALIREVTSAYSFGQARPSSFIANIISREKSGTMWVVQQVIDIREPIVKEAD